MGAAPRRGLGVAGDRNGRAGVGARTRQSARRHPNGARPRRYGAMSDRGDGPRASVIEPAKSRARIPCFQGLAVDFPGDRNGRAGVGARTRQSARRHPNGARPRRCGASPDRCNGLRPSAIEPKTRARIHVFKALWRIFRAVITAEARHGAEPVRPLAVVAGPGGRRKTRVSDWLWRHDDSGERRAPRFPWISVSPFGLPATTDQGRLAVE